MRAHADALAAVNAALIEMMRALPPRTRMASVGQRLMQLVQPTHLSLVQRNGMEITLHLIPPLIALPLRHNTVMVMVVPSPTVAVDARTRRRTFSCWAGPCRRRSPALRTFVRARWTSPPAWPSPHPGCRGRGPAGRRAPDGDRCPQSASPPPAWITMLISPSYMAMATLRMTSGW